jgi:hypothetical protein
MRLSFPVAKFAMFDQKNKNHRHVMAKSASSSLNR